MFTSVQAIREYAGFQNYKVDSPLRTTGVSTVWLVSASDVEKFVPRLYDGSSTASIGDVVVKYQGSSILGISAIDSTLGTVTLSQPQATSGSCLLATFASSPVSSQRVMDFINTSHSTVLSYVGKRYTLPLGVCVPLLYDLETKLAASNLLTGSYGISSEDSSEDGYALSEGVLSMLAQIGDGDLPLIDSNGEKVPVNTGGIVGGSNSLGGQATRVKGYLFTPAQEEFEIVNSQTAGSSLF